MSILHRALNGVQSTLGCFREIFGYGLQFLWAMLQPKAMLAARLLAGNRQLASYLAMNLRPSACLTCRRG
jgi:hypothetical protein